MNTLYKHVGKKQYGQLLSDIFPAHLIRGERLKPANGAVWQMSSKYMLMQFTSDMIN